MPLVKVETRRWMQPATKRQLFDAIHSALVAAFQIPEDDRVQRLIEYAPEDFELLPGRGERFTIVTVSAFVGRSLDAKRRLYRELAERLEPVGIPREDLFVLVEEHPLENFGIRGGIAASDVELGFAVRV
jgi:phenylpyruvate tautomerase PptA (4-oxalocrotonate tautomerase family)